MYKKHVSLFWTSKRVGGNVVSTHGFTKLPTDTPCLIKDPLAKKRLLSHLQRQRSKEDKREEGTRTCTFGGTLVLPSRSSGNVSHHSPTMYDCPLRPSPWCLRESVSESLHRTNLNHSYQSSFLPSSSLVPVVYHRTNTEEDRYGGAGSHE